MHKKHLKLNGSAQSKLEFRERSGRAHCYTHIHPLVAFKKITLQRFSIRCLQLDMFPILHTKFIRCRHLGPRSLRNGTGIYDLPLSERLSAHHIRAKGAIRGGGNERLLKIKQSGEQNRQPSRSHDCTFGE